MDLNLRGKTALITCASKGIGLASAECLAEEGVNRCLLMTDGLANQGITDHDALARHAAELRARGVSVTTFHITAGVYLVAISMLSSAVGGYLAGRLRARWADTHNDEIYFRDTAHGLLAWA